MVQGQRPKVPIFRIFIEFAFITRDKPFQVNSQVISLLISKKFLILLRSFFLCLDWSIIKGFDLNSFSEIVVTINPFDKFKPNLIHLKEYKIQHEYAFKFVRSLLL